MSAKNPCAKRRSPDNPYASWRSGDYQYKLLKSYQSDNKGEYARWHVAVKSPHNPSGGWELGDEYVEAGLYRISLSSVQVDPTVFETPAHFLGWAWGK